MIEAGALLNLDGEAIYWHLPPGRTGGSLPDSRDLWDVIWENRKAISGFAHSHPGSGVPGPSYTDVTTFAAIEAGLGQRLDWWIISSDAACLVSWIGPGRLDYAVLPVRQHMPWSPRLRELSEISP